MPFGLLHVFHVELRGPLLKKAERHIGRNVVSLIIKMRSIVQIFKDSDASQKFGRMRQMFYNILEEASLWHFYQMTELVEAIV